jgi:hypothetical protein
MGQVIDLADERRKRNEQRNVRIVRRSPASYATTSNAATPPTRADRAANPYTICWDDDNGIPVHPTACPNGCAFPGSCLELDCPIWGAD